jgi:hypothetical protein
MYNTYINENNSIYDDIRKTQYIQQPSNNILLNNPFQAYNNNNNSNNYQKRNDSNINYNYNYNYNPNQRYTVAPFPSDSFDIDNANNSGIINSEHQNKLPSSLKTQKIKTQRDGRTITNNSSNNLIKTGLFGDNNKNKRQPMDEISNKIIQKPPFNSSKDNSNNNFINNILNKNNIKINKSVIDNNNNNKFINKNIISKSTNQKMNQYLTLNNNTIKNNNLNNNQIKNNNANNNKNINSSLERKYLQNQFKNRNNSMLTMLKKIQFFERLNKIGEERMRIFENEFQKDAFFMNKNFFNNTSNNEQIIENDCPLTLIFHYIFNPQIINTQYPYKKNFFESIFQLRGDMNIKTIYNQNDIKYIPKYFNDLNYINNLFNNFNEKDLNIFINEIEKWAKTFKFEIQYIHPLINNIGQNQIEINDVATIYFVSPNDLIVDYHSYIQNFLVSIIQYNFHCDINYDKKNGRFVFKTSSIVYNKLQKTKENNFQNVIQREINNLNSVELPVHTWRPLLNVIDEETKKNKNISDKIFKEHIRKTLNKYSKNRPQLNYEEEKFENSKNFNNSKNNTDNNQQKIKANIINYDINNNQKINTNKQEKISKTDRAFTFSPNFVNQNNNNTNTIINNDKDMDGSDILLKNENKMNNAKNEDKENNIINDKEINDKEINNNLNIANKNNKDKDKEEVEDNPYLFYGVLITFFLFTFKTVFGIESGAISSETFFNLLIIAIIGFMLIKKYILDNDQQNRM